MGELARENPEAVEEMEWLQEGDAHEDDADRTPIYRITDLMGAESEMERLAVLKARKATVEAHAREMLERKAFEVNLWKKAQLQQVEREVEHREALLTEYLDMVGEKSIAVVAGRFRYRKVGEKLKVVNETAARAWVACQADAEIFLSKPKERTVLSSVLQKHLKAVGEIPDGCEVEPEGRKFETVMA